MNTLFAHGLRRNLTKLSGALALTSLVAAANAAVTFSGSSGSLAASAEFQVVNLLGVDYLEIRLTNTSAADTVDPADLLTGVFFTLSGASNVLTNQGGQTGVFLEGSTVTINGTTPGPTGGGNVGGEFAFVSGLTTNLLPGPSDPNIYYGVSSSGLGLFGPGDVFSSGSNLDGPGDPNGMNYGITSTGDNPATKNPGQYSSVPLINDSVLITLMEANAFDLATLDLNTIGNVTFQYGTGLDEPRFTSTITAIPETSSTLTLGGVLLAGAFMRVRRRKLTK